ncbi:MAG: ZIP family metal transporter [Legionellaceae bacterium]|nr:ZIP family metal transporter [Legionellaceae bacterium]
MQHEFLIKLGIAFIIFVLMLISGRYPLRLHSHKSHGHDHHHNDEHAHSVSIGETLATGIFLGAGLLHMLPEANSLFESAGYHYPFAYLITGILFLLFLWLEHIGKEMYQAPGSKQGHFAILAWLMLSFHSLMVGTALGLTQSSSMMIILFFATIAHKWAESIAIAIQLHKTNLSSKTIQLLFFSFTLMTPLGIALGYSYDGKVPSHSIIEPILVAASGGTFLYLGTLHGLERCVLVERCCNLKDFSYVIVGFLLMAAVAIYL